MNRPSSLCLGEQGAKYQKKVWEEVLDVLGAVVPEARAFALQESNGASAN